MRLGICWGLTIATTRVRPCTLIWMAGKLSGGCRVRISGASKHSTSCVELKCKQSDCGTMDE
ncbi:unnamed protein product [Linum tenue]|uniref:Secreted protein n=1 Tax=Linum tenue TaxID=586396 RepID=A0AAV0IH26_9ROSI|nr:unnamed protein product [Linum tenue]